MVAAPRTGGNWLQGRVLAQHRWTPRLFSLRVSAPALPFEAGQFAKLALDIDGERIARPYSFVNPPGAQDCEFYYSVLPEGPLSPRLAALAPGDAVWLGANPSGFLVLSEVPQAEQLWLLSTGTGVGPFLSILQTEAPWTRYRRVVLVHAVREAADLSYRDTMQELARQHAGRLLCLSVVSREEAPQSLRGRIPALLACGALESAAGCAISPDASQFMLCGNPQMVKDTIDVLAARGLKKHRRRDPGQITVENYW